MVKALGFDRTLLAATLVLTLIGLLMIYSSTMIVAKEKYHDSFYFFKRQLLWLALGLLVFVAIGFLRQPLYLNQRIVLAVLGFSYLGLLLVFFFERVNNTQPLGAFRRFFRSTVGIRQNCGGACTWP